MTRPIRYEICCDNACPNYGTAQEHPYTDAEIAQMEADRQAFANQRAAEEAAAQALANLKASAKAKLIAGSPLTAEEADTLVL